MLEICKANVKHLIQSFILSEKKKPSVKKFLNIVTFFIENIFGDVLIEYTNFNQGKIEGPDYSYLYHV